MKKLGLYHSLLFTYLKWIKKIKTHPARYIKFIVPATSLKKGFILIYIFSITVISYSQPSGMAGSFSRLGHGPRGMGMGNVLMAVEGEGIYGYYNPALAAKAKVGNQLDVSTSLMSFDRTLNSINSTFRLPPSAGINIALLHAGVTDIDGRDPNGYATGRLATNEFQLLTAFGINISKQLAVGLGVKASLADFHSDVSNTEGFGFDIGALYQLKPSLTLAFAAQDLLASYSWNSGGLYGDESLAETTEKFPHRFSIGGSYRLRETVVVAGSFDLLMHKDQRFQQLKIGGSWRLHERISLRMGWQVDDLKYISGTHRPGTGFSLHLPFDKLAPSIDYAFIVEPGQISAMHVFGLRLNL